jgi:hypothetical protein
MPPRLEPDDAGGVIPGNVDRERQAVADRLWAGLAIDQADLLMQAA